MIVQTIIAATIMLVIYGLATWYLMRVTLRNR